jgi:aminoglycoside/choline kinase family phosphotransferase
LCHGDFRLDNLFFANGAGHAPLTVLDWQISFKGNGAYDLAYFISQSLNTDDRRSAEKALIDRYVAVLADNGVAVEAEIAWPRGGSSLYVRDPAGNSVELAPARIWGLSAR